MFDLKRFNINILVKLLMDEIGVKFLIIFDGYYSRLIIHDFCRFDNAKLAHQMSSPGRRLFLNIAIPLSVRQSIVFWLILHVFEFIADVHLDEFMCSVQCECGPPEIELVLFRWSVAPDQLVKAIAAVVYRTQELVT